VVNDVYSAIDLIIFRRYIAPSLGITHRFVGTEPYCKVTAQYNQAMHHWLEDELVILRPLKCMKSTEKLMRIIIQYQHQLFAPFEQKQTVSCKKYGARQYHALLIQLAESKSP
jgi:citrate lyase synthetase